MTTPLLDAFELVAHSEQQLLRLDAAAAELAKRPGLNEEKAWLDLARQRVAEAREGVGDLVTRALRLPELEPVKGDYARIFQGAAVDALERLHAGIMFAGGNRAPLIEALYWKLKLPVLRRCDRADFEKFCADFEKRLDSSYARRMLADPAYAVVAPALQDLRRSFATWRGVFTAGRPPAAETDGLRAELDTTARRIEDPCRQARLLAQAALVPLRELLESSGLAQKPKRRGARSSADDDDNHPLLERDPPDPAEPSPEELAELTAAQATGEAEGAATAPRGPEPAAARVATDAAAPPEAEAMAEPASPVIDPVDAEPVVEKPRRGPKGKPLARP